MTPILLFFYQVGLFGFGAVYLAIRLIQGKGLPGIRERLALYPPELAKQLRSLQRPVWVHAVSVGEVLAARPLIEELKRRFPRRDWLVTTTTATGRHLARKTLQDFRTRVLYLPWDLGPVVRRAVKTIRPALFISFETELWPVLFDRMGRDGVPIAVVNGRISPRGYGRYLWVRPWMHRVLAPVSLFLTQSPQDARRYAALGAAKDRIVVSGNLKWDLNVAASSNGSQAERQREWLGLDPAQTLWTAGSTHAGEEKQIFQIFARLKSRYPGLRLLIAPRHPERVQEVEREAVLAGLKTVRRSQWTGTGAGRWEADTVILLDTVGELAGFYRLSGMVFVGGSLVPHGGHNLVEPASMSRPILSGPHLQNFQAISESLLQAKGMRIVQSPEELEQAVSRLLESPGQAREMGLRAHAVFQQNQGTLKRTADLIGLRWGRVLS